MLPCKLGPAAVRSAGASGQGGLISSVLPAPAVDIRGSEAQVEEKDAHELRVKPVRNQGQAINLRSVVLKPVN
jgi:hypothetical protein